MQAVLRQQFAVGRGHHHVEIGVGAVGERAAGKGRLDADHGGIGRDRQRQLALDRAAAGFRHAHSDGRFERTGGCRNLVELHLEARLAGGVGRRHVLEFLARGRDFVVGEPERITGKARPRAGRRNRCRAGQIEIGGRCAIEEMSIDTQLRRRAARNDFGRRSEIEFDAVGDVILDQEVCLANRRTLGIGIGDHAPGTGRGRRNDRHAPAMAAEALIGDHGAAIFDAVRALHHQSQRRRSRNAARVAQQRGHTHRLAAAVDAALGIDERVQSGRHLPPGDAAVGQIESRRFQAEEGVIGLVGRNDRGRRLTALAARQTGFEMNEAVVVGRLFASTSLLRATSLTATAALGSALASE